MPRKKTTSRARNAKAPSTQAGDYVREEIEHVRRREHGARSAKQAIAIGLSKARKAGSSWRLRLARRLRNPRQEARQIPGVLGQRIVHWSVKARPPLRIRLCQDKRVVAHGSAVAPT
ncbi:MAG TPA: hypothetical protein VMT32_03250 [Bryobacteraceae bacterium]|nr:hypothetical protein [Bryobacteraceae bacterium]